MKILMPKEMKVRLVANVLGIVLSFLNAGYATWYFITVVDAGGLAIWMGTCSLAAAGLYFLMAKIMWALQKKTKIIGWFVLGAVGALGSAGSALTFMAIFFDRFNLDQATGWSIGIGLLSGAGGLLIVAGKLIGEMVEKLKFLSYIGFGCIAGLVVLLTVFGTTVDVHEWHLISAGVGSFVLIAGSIVTTIIGYIAESILIKKKFLVYN
jgi:hypothetical protein